MDQVQSSGKVGSTGFDLENQAPLPVNSKELSSSSFPRGIFLKNAIGFLAVAGLLACAVVYSSVWSDQCRHRRLMKYADLLKYKIDGETISEWFAWKMISLDSGMTEYSEAIDELEQHAEYEEFKETIQGMQENTSKFEDVIDQLTYGIAILSLDEKLPQSTKVLIRFKEWCAHLQFPEARWFTIAKDNAKIKKEMNRQLLNHMKNGRCRNLDESKMEADFKKKVDIGSERFTKWLEHAKSYAKQVCLFDLFDELFYSQESRLHFHRNEERITPKDLDKQCRKLGYVCENTVSIFNDTVAEYNKMIDETTSEEEKHKIEMGAKDEFVRKMMDFKPAKNNQ